MSVQATVDTAVANARAYAAAPLDAASRCAALRSLANALRADPDPLAALLVEEVRKPITLARAEVVRAAEIAERSAAEWETLAGEVLATDTSAGAEGRLVMVRRHPIGVVCAITPFNFPVGLALHKLAPALVAGNACVVKPSERAPRTALALRDLTLEAGFPGGAVSVVDGGPDVVDALLAHPGLDLYTFTGSVGVGAKVKAASGLRPVVLELGSNAAAIVEASADLDRAARAIAMGAYAFAGQACFSVQRVIVERTVAEPFAVALEEAIAGLAVGAPEDPEVLVGPLIDEPAAVRVQAAVAAAVSAGARVLRGGARDGALLEPTLLTDVARDAPLWREEVFGPVAALAPFDGLDEAIAMANDSVYGLETAIFTGELAGALRAADELRAGAVVVNDASWRCTPMPFGGIGASGFGREGPRYAIEATTVQRAVSLAP
jgi:acyl-CoA reductase-like NAD-dependent aldehyde dehydrogenase